MTSRFLFGSKNFCKLFSVFFEKSWFCTDKIESNHLVDAGCSASCTTVVGDVGVAELEELVDKLGTTIGT